MGDLEYPHLRLGDGLARRDLEYLLGDLPPLSPLSPLLLEDDLCRLCDGGELLLWPTGDLSRFSAVLFLVGESFFDFGADGGNGGVSFRDIVRSARFGDRVDREGGSREEVARFSEISFLVALSTAVFFSCFIDFFGLSTELSVELSDDWRFRLVELFFFSCLSFPSTLSFFFLFFFFFFDSASDELLSSEFSLESDDVTSVFLCLFSFFFFFSFFLPDLGAGLSDLSRALCFFAFFFFVLVLPERFRFFFSATAVAEAASGGSGGGGGGGGGGAGLGVRTSS